MTHTKKRILAMLLAVVLMFSSLPFSVSADELPGELSTEITVERQPEESQAEETEESPPPAENTITISDSSGDMPVLYAQDPFNTVKSEVEGGTNYMTSVGVTRESIVRELEAHEDDNYYLGTPYAGGDAQSPNGDTSYNSGAAGMNCAGFISYVLRKAGLDAETTMEIMHKTPVSQFGSGLPYDWLAGASNYKNLIENGNISAYAFRTKQELLSSGLAEKGDIILMWWSNSPGADGADNHIGFYWGEASDDDVMWHSGTEPSSGNQISAITPKTPGSFYILIKIEPVKPKEYTVTLTKTSADVSITQGNSAYSLAGATYNVYKGTSGTGSVVATFTTDEAGHATLSTPLEDGTYSVKEVTPPKGYKLDEKIYTFTINGADTSLSVEDEPGTLTLKLKKYYIEDVLPRILEPDTFDRIQEELAKRGAKRPTSEKAKTPFGRYSGKYALSTLVVCGKCGALYRRVTWYRKGEKQIMWRCGTRLDGKANCPDSPTLEENKLQSAVMEAISQQYIHKDETLGVTMQSIRSVLTPETADSEYAIRTKINELQKEKKDLIARALAENDDGKYDFQFARIKQELEQLQAQLEGVQAVQKAQAVDEVRMAEIAALLEKFKESGLAFDDLLVRKVVETVRVESAETLEITFKDGNRRVVELPGRK